MKLNKKIGICHICLEKKLLTFEHIPPECCLNKSRVKIGNNISQKGIGAYTLCERCNSITGGWYINDYKKLFFCAHDFLVNNKDESITGYGITLKEFNPLYCAKQMLVILLSILTIDVIKKYNFRDLLLNKSSSLNEKHKGFQLLIGSSLDFKEGNIFKGPILLNGVDQCFCLDVYPFKLVFICNGGYSFVPGFVDFTDLLYSPDLGNIIHTFNVGYCKNNLFDIIKDNLNNK